ncbi:MAG: hypothetical protein COB38_02310 [Gammaproteobacteria bacterium]|nr:MAG: hypothetical protein COB38_02310 [Gammaproteobacteria bacterium]
MNQKVLIIVLALFLIGNFHVVTDWCDDLPVDSVTYDSAERDLIEQNIDLNQGNGHNADTDLCGHCGHLGLNIMQITPSEIDIFTSNAKSKPIEQKTTFNSYCTSPPTRPPLQLS